MSVNTIVEFFHKEQQQNMARMEKIICGEPLSPMKKAYETRKKAIHTVIENKAQHTTLEFLRGIAHNFTL